MSTEQYVELAIVNGVSGGYEFALKGTAIGVKRV